MRISDFEWDEGNCLHLQFGHGIEPGEAEEIKKELELVRR